MAEWEVLLFLCIVGMALLATIAILFGKIGDLWLAVADLQDDQQGVMRDLMCLKTEVDAMATQEAEKTKERKEDLMSSTVWFFIGVLTGSLVATAALLLSIEWLLRRKR